MSAGAGFLGFLGEGKTVAFVGEPFQNCQHHLLARPVLPRRASTTSARSAATVVRRKDRVLLFPGAAHDAGDSLECGFMAERFLYLARHGETDWNLQQRWQGHTDIALNQTGQAQARVLAEALSSVPLGGIVSSDLVRAHETARIAGECLGLPVAYMDPDLRERSFGVFEGLTREQCVASQPDAWRAWVESQKTPLGGEERTAVAARMVRALERAAATIAGDAPILVVTHGGALRAAVNTVAAMPPPIANGAIWCISWNGRITEAHAFAKGG
jgi:broad specificity phosphatase PhoE